MPDTKITALTAITTVDPAVDVLPIVDVSDTTMAASGTTKKITSNQILGAGGTATLASATITGDLTVDTSTLKVDSANNRVGIGTASPARPLDIVGSFQSSLGWVLTGTPAGLGAATRYIGGASTTDSWYYNAVSGGNHIWAFGESSAMTLNSTGLGIGGSPSSKLTVFAGADGDVGFFRGGSTRQVQIGTSSTVGYLNVDNTSSGFELRLNGTARVNCDSSGNVGIGVTPSAAVAGNRKIEIGGNTNAGMTLSSTSANAAARNWSVLCNFNAFGDLVFNQSTALGGDPIAAGTTRMTLDASGNLLVGVTSGSNHNIRKQGTTVEGDTHLNVGNAEHVFFACSSVTYNAAAAAQKVTRNSSTLRSINAGGTINASGADYAEYMTKCSDFVLSKGSIAGVDANGKLTNVFADAISFVVKSTDPSYVGNDKWGTDLEGDALEAARQLVDRIAFAGQVPVNVIGAKAGDYIVPVVDGTAIKGIAVSKPTFEQYQIAVGKVIAIDADGRARIIVKVA